MRQIAAIFLLLACTCAWADLHKWVDANGKVHYSDDDPPEDVKAQTLRGSVTTSAETVAPASGTPATKTIYEQAADINKANKAKEEAAQKAAKEQEEAQIKKKNCEQSRSQLLTLQNSPRIATYDENGERVFMDDSARQKGIEEAQAAVGKYCN